MSVNQNGDAAHTLQCGEVDGVLCPAARAFRGEGGGDKRALAFGRFVADAHVRVVGIGVGMEEIEGKLRGNRFGEVDARGDEHALALAVVHLIAGERNQARAVLPNGKGVVACAYHRPGGIGAIVAPRVGGCLLVEPSFGKRQSVVSAYDDRARVSRSGFSALRERRNHIAHDALRAVEFGLRRSVCKGRALYARGDYGESVVGDTGHAIAHIVRVHIASLTVGAGGRSLPRELHAAVGIAHGLQVGSRLGHADREVARHDGADALAVAIGNSHFVGIHCHCSLRVGPLRLRGRA